MLIQHIVLPGIVLPSIVALLFLLTVQGLSRRGFGAGMAIAAAFLAAFVGLTSWPRWPPIDSAQRLFYLVALTGLISLLVSFLRQGRLTWIVRGTLLGLLLTALLKSKIQHAWSKPQAALWLLPLLALGLLLIHAWGRSLAADAGKSQLLSAALRLAVLGGSAFSLGLSGSARLGQLAGALACALLVVELVFRYRSQARWQEGDAAVVTTAIFGLLLMGFFYAELSPWVALLLLAAHLLLALPSTTAKLWRLSPLLPLAIALALVLIAAMGQEDDPYDYSWLPAPQNYQVQHESAFIGL
jgi:hypothetical protein